MLSDSLLDPRLCFLIQYEQLIIQLMLKGYLHVCQPRVWQSRPCVHTSSKCKRCRDIVPWRKTLDISTSLQAIDDLTSANQSHPLLFEGLLLPLRRHHSYIFSGTFQGLEFGKTGSHPLPLLSPLLLPHATSFSYFSRSHTVSSCTHNSQYLSFIP